MIKNKSLNILLLASTLSFSASIAHANTSLGAFIKHDGWSLSDIQKFNSETNKSMAVTTLFTNFNMNWDSLNIQASNIVSEGATPMITLMPYSDRHVDMLAAISAGEEDAYINDWIDSFKAWKETYPADKQPKILLRFAHEFNGNWYPWGNNPEGLKAAWKHIHNLFEVAEVNDSVEWVWCASATNVDDYNDMTQYYPGDDVVDWTSLDGYNWGSNYSFTSWRTFDEVFSSAYTTLVTNYPDKPIVIAEVGSAEPSDQPNPEWGQYGDDADATQSKEVWVNDMFTRIMESYPAISAVSWFNINKELSWALNETAKSGLPNTGLNAYNKVVENDYFLETLNFETTSQTETVIVEETNKKIGKGKANAKNSTPESSLIAASSSTSKNGFQIALANSRMPNVVGERLLDKEANGFRNLSKEVLSNISKGRMTLSK